jgi:hypothetical protein
MKRNINDIPVKKQMKALKDLGVDNFSIKPCKEFNPDCSNCRLYILEGMLSWYNDLLKC